MLEIYYYSMYKHTSPFVLAIHHRSSSLFYDEIFIYTHDHITILYYVFILSLVHTSTVVSLRGSVGNILLFSYANIRHRLCCYSCARYYIECTNMPLIRSLHYGCSSKCHDMDAYLRVQSWHLDIETMLYGHLCLQYFSL